MRSPSDRTGDAGTVVSARGMNNRDRAWRVVLSLAERRGGRHLRATVAPFLLLPGLALAAGNNLTMTGATYDTTGQKFGSGALSGGYGVTPASFITGTTYVANGLPVSETIADGKWHHLAVLVASAMGPTFKSEEYVQAFIDGIPIHNGGLFASTNLLTASGGPDGTPLQVDPAGVKSIVTGVGVGAMKSYGGGTLSPFAGEIDEAACWSPAGTSDSAPGFMQVPSAPYVGSEVGLLGLWHLDSNGTDSATYAAPSVTGYVPQAQNQNPAVASYPAATTPSGGFPLQ